MTQNTSPVVTRGLILPPVLGRQVAAYVDRCPAGFRRPGAAPVALWRDGWGAGRVRVWGADLPGVRLRLVAERVAPGAGAEWGLI